MQQSLQQCCSVFICSCCLPRVWYVCGLENNQNDFVIPLTGEFHIAWRCYKGTHAVKASYGGGKEDEEVKFY